MTVSGTNFGKAAGDYGTFRAGFPESIFDRLAGFNVGQPDQTVIDLGTGTGVSARALRIIGGRKRRLRRLPMAAGWTRYRDLPAPQGRTFMSRWAAGERPPP